MSACGRACRRGSFPDDPPCDACGALRFDSPPVVIEGLQRTVKPYADGFIDEPTTFQDITRADIPEHENYLPPSRRAGRGRRSK